MALVITRLMGGLGNQMFQYAAGYALSRRWNVPLFVDPGFLDARPPGMNWTPRELELDVLKAPLSFPTDQQVRSYRRELDVRAVRVAHRYFPRVFRSRCFVERGPGFDPAFLRIKPPIYLEGFWQNEAYFRGVANELRACFEPKGSPTASVRRTLEDIRTLRSASVHVRRGDYVLNAEASAFHGTCSPAYYQDASRWLVREHGVEHFHVFSDDPDWARKNLSLGRPTTFVDPGIGKDAHWDMYLMAHCTHHIIANSSFSWWGAWLDPHPDKVVVAPNIWYQGNATPSSHFIPSSWTAR
ncbi:MAG: alpha-1,2-fucosyltransferase [Flavobacteriales bacterium]|nr:alpha-1,2-fucosyltransferase [Flavobacteriales bacterium]